LCEFRLRTAIHEDEDKPEQAHMPWFPSSCSLYGIGSKVEAAKFMPAANLPIKLQFIQSATVDLLEGHSKVA
jgi:hypothetical protein